MNNFNGMIHSGTFPNRVNIFWIDELIFNEI